MKRNRAILVALIVLALASALMFFVVLPQMRGDKAEDQEATTVPATSTKTAVTAPDAGQKAAANTGATSVATPAQQPAKQASVVPDDNAKPKETQIASAGDTPSFDVLRVEPDGSAVIAGRAAPGAQVDITDGQKVISTVKAGVSGDFAAVLDQPLAIGDHQLVIEATGADGKKSVSEEVATVSIPKDKASELLAMVTKPGEASRIITMPAAAVAETASDAAQTPSSTPAVASQATAGDATQPAQTTAQASAGKAEVQVSAVEIEGRKLFVAGMAPAGSTLNVYADDKLVATVKADEKGRFVADNEVPLTVGNHTIRADVLNAAGDKVAFRASVPFFRPEGEQMAAVADNGEQPMQPLADGAYDKARTEAATAIGLLKKLYDGGRTPSAEELAAARSATEIALKTLSEIKLPANADGVAREMAAKTTGDAAKALTLLKSLPQDPSAIRTALASIESAVSTAVEPAITVTADKQAPVATDKTASATSGETSAAATPGAVGSEPDTQAAQQKTASADEAAVPATTAPAAAAADGDQPKVIQQAPLQHSETSVIIRRGDTLWQISRRVYGRGVRYTTIYMANKDQIEDPDRILPGQIFGVPDKPLDNSEQLHRKRLGL